MNVRDGTSRRLADIRRATRFRVTSFAFDPASGTAFYTNDNTGFRDLMAVGTAQECRDKVAEYIDAGVTCPILFPMMDDIKAVVDAFAGWSP